MFVWVMFGWLKDKRFCVICRCNFCLPSLRPSNVLPNIQWPSNRPTGEPRYPPFALTLTWGHFFNGKESRWRTFCLCGAVIAGGGAAMLLSNSLTSWVNWTRLLKLRRGKMAFFFSELEYFWIIDNWLFFYGLGYFVVTQNEDLVKIYSMFPLLLWLCLSLGD